MKKNKLTTKHCKLWICFTFFTATFAFSSVAYAHTQVPSYPCSKHAGDSNMEKSPKEPTYHSHHNFDWKKYKEDLSEYIISYAGLTPDEAHEFLPVFFEMQDKVRALHRQKGRVYRNASENEMNERDCHRAIHTAMSLDKKRHRIECSYIQRLQKIVGSQKVVKAIVADRKFGRKVFKRMTAEKKK